MLRILAGLILGAIVGLVFGSEIEMISPVIDNFFCLLFGIAIAYLKQHSDKHIQIAVSTTYFVFEGFAEVMCLTVTHHTSTSSL